MALSTRKRWYLLGGLLAATLGAVLWLDEDNADAPQVVASAKPGQAPAARTPEQASGQAVQEETLALGALKRQVPEEEPEDVFGAKSWYVPPPPPKPQPPPPPAPPPLPFTYIGRMVEDGRTTAFLSRQDKNYAVKAGDVIDGSYRVDTIDMGAVIFTYLPLNMQQTLVTGAMGGTR
jgi:hypothetical protein